MGQLFQSGTDPEFLLRLALMRRCASCAMSLGSFHDGQGMARREPVSTEARALCVDGAVDGGCRKQRASLEGGAGRCGSGHACHEGEAAIGEVPRPARHWADAGLSKSNQQPIWAQPLWPQRGGNAGRGARRASRARRSAGWFRQHQPDSAVAASGSGAGDNDRLRSTDRTGEQPCR